MPPLPGKMMNSFDDKAPLLSLLPKNGRRQRLYMVKVVRNADGHPSSNEDPVLIPLVPRWYNLKADGTPYNEIPAIRQSSFNEERSVGNKPIEDRIDSDEEWEEEDVPFEPRSDGFEDDMEENDENFPSNSVHIDVTPVTSPVPPDEPEDVPSDADDAEYVLSEEDEAEDDVRLYDCESNDHLEDVLRDGSEEDLPEQRYDPVPLQNGPEEIKYGGFSEEVYNGLVEYLRSGVEQDSKNAEFKMIRKTCYTLAEDGESLLFLFVSKKDKPPMKKFVVKEGEVPGMIQQVHELIGHLGQDKTIKAVAKKLHWPTLREDVKAFVRNCDVCWQKKSDGSVNHKASVDIKSDSLIHVESRRGERALGECRLAITLGSASMSSESVPPPAPPVPQTTVDDVVVVAAPSQEDIVISKQKLKKTDRTVKAKEKPEKKIKGPSSTDPKNGMIILKKKAPKENKRKPDAIQEYESRTSPNSDVTSTSSRNDVTPVTSPPPSDEPDDVLYEEDEAEDYADRGSNDHLEDGLRCGAEEDVPDQRRYPMPPQNGPKGDRYGGFSDELYDDLVAFFKSGVVSKKLSKEISPNLRSYYSLSDDGKTLFFINATGKDKTPRRKVVVRKGEVEAVVRRVHELIGHLGQGRSIKAVSKNLHWLTLRDDVKAYIWTCAFCNQKKEEKKHIQKAPVDLNCNSLFQVEIREGVPRGERIYITLDPSSIDNRGLIKNENKGKGKNKRKQSRIPSDKENEPVRKRKMLSEDDNLQNNARQLRRGRPV